MSFQSPEQTKAPKANDLHTLAGAEQTGPGLDPHKVNALDLFRQDAAAGKLSGAGYASSAAIHQGQLLLEGAVTGGLLDPLNGAIRGWDAVTGAKVSQIELPNQDEVNNSVAGKIGKWGAIGGEMFVGLGMLTGVMAGALTSDSAILAAPLVTEGASIGMGQELHNDLDHVSTTNSNKAKYDGVVGATSLLGSESGVLGGGALATAASTSIGVELNPNLLSGTPSAERNPSALSQLPAAEQSGVPADPSIAAHATLADWRHSEGGGLNQLGKPNSPDLKAAPAN